MELEAEDIWVMMPSGANSQPDEVQFIFALRDLVRHGGSPLPDELRRSRVLSPDIAAIYIGLTATCLRWHRAHNSGPAYLRLGRNRVGYLVADLDRWLNALRVAPRRPAYSRKRPTAKGSQT